MYTEPAKVALGGFCGEVYDYQVVCGTDVYDGNLLGVTVFSGDVFIIAG